MTEDKKKEKKPALKPKADPMETVNKMNEATQRMEAANAKREELLDRQDGEKTQEALDGKADAGEGNAEESPEEYANKVMGNDVEKPKDA